MRSGFHNKTKAVIHFAMLAVLALSISVSARATTIDPYIWQQLVVDSEFIGIVECEAAGGVVARYRVIESWKGPAAGTRFNVRIAVNYWGPQFPVTFVGQRFLMTAFGSPASSRLISTTSGSPVPLWWRNIPSDYNLPLWQGRVALPLEKSDKPLGGLGSEHADLESFQKAVTELLSLGAEAREVRLLQALSHKYMFARLEEAKADAKNAQALEDFKKLRTRIDAAKSGREIVSSLLTTGLKYPDSRYSVGEIIEQGGGPITLELIKKTSRVQTPWDDETYKRTIATIEYRLSVKRPEMPVRDDDTRPSSERLAHLRTTLLKGQESEEFGEAFEALTRYDPGPVAQYLVNWQNPGKSWHDSDAGYVLGSYFAWRCGRDRQNILLILLAAKDPFIRVAGAVYLAFENPALGKEKLEELMALPGDPGAWAALALATRGHKTAVPRLLEILATAGPRGHMSGVHHENFQLRVLLLLSNSAAASALPQPKPSASEPDYSADQATYEKYVTDVYQFYRQWWSANQSRIKLHDPWFTILEQQKVD